MKEWNKQSQAFKMTGVCGIYCAECECAKAKDSPKLLEYLINAGIKAQGLPCPGCRAVQGNCPAIDGCCATYRCAEEKGVDFCFECEEYPCAKLNPTADRAAVLPHNLKAFNLSYIQNQGLDKFVENAAEIKQRYYKGKMLIGKGPHLDVTYK